MSQKSWIVAGLVGVMLLSLGSCAYLVSGLVHAGQAAMATGAPVEASPGTWVTLVLSLFGVPVSGGAAAIVAWLMKAAPVVSPQLGEMVGQHQAVLTAILSGLQIAGGQPAESKGEATLNGGRLVWSFTFTPTETTK